MVRSCNSVSITTKHILNTRKYLEKKQSIQFLLLQLSNYNNIAKNLIATSFGRRRSFGLQRGRRFRSLRLDQTCMQPFGGIKESNKRTAFSGAAALGAGAAGCT
jgi:hypothetical protein